MLDDMERAINAMGDAKDVKAVKEGVQLVYQKMKSITEGKGLKAMETVGKEFDADLHDAIANVPVNDAKQKGKVIEEIEKGYILTCQSHPKTEKVVVDFDVKWQISSPDTR